MDERTIEDRLRQEYFELLPEIRKVADHLESQIKFRLLGTTRTLDRYERVLVKARVKDCESAVESLRRRQEGQEFDLSRATEYRLLDLKDLAGVRVLAFPPARITEVDHVLREIFPEWVFDPVRGHDGEILASKYWGFCEASDRVKCEYQVASMLVGLFWEIEHSAIYKPAPELRGIALSQGVKAATHRVLQSLAAFEQEFERIKEQATHQPE